MKSGKASTTPVRKSKRSASAQPKTNAPTSKLSNKSKRIPPPPGPDASWEEQSSYFDKYSLDEVEKAGYFQPVNDKKFLDELARSARAQQKREQVNISLEPEQVVQLKRIAKRKHLSPSTLARVWLLDRLIDELTKS